MTKICIITPVYNSAVLVKDTFNSIISQYNKTSFDLTYIVYDGGSLDDINLLIEKRYRSLFEQNNISFSYVSQKDHGMYDALAKGFSKAGKDHDIYTYINAGDYYSPYALTLVSELFKEYNLDWLTGANARYTSKGYLSTCDLPVVYPSWLIQRGVFGSLLPAIQQESTFWSRRLHEKIDFHQFSQFRYAGDFYLWKTFSEFSDLKIACVWLSGFRIHDGQLSQVAKKAYIQEFREIADRLGTAALLYACLLRLCWHLPVRLKLLINKDIILV